MLNEFEDQDYIEAPNDKENIVNTPPRSWNELTAQQRANRETQEMAQNQQMFDQFGTIEQNAKQQAMLRDRQKAIAGAAMMESAFRNGGMSDRSLSPAFSEAFGQPILGGQFVDLGEGRGRGFVLYGAGKDAQGNPSVAPVAMMDNAQMMRVLQRAGLGDRTAGLQKELYGEMSSRLTPDQLGNMGIQNPSAPISTGGAVISAAGMRALRGLPRQRSTISVYSNVGGDGRIGTGSRSATIRPDGTRDEETTGTRSSDYQGKWKVLESNGEGTRYENDKTGEVVSVPKGNSLGDVIAARQRKQGSGLTFDEKLQLQREAEASKAAREAAQSQNRLAIAQMNATQRQKAVEAANELKKLGIDIGIDLAEAKAAETAANSMDRATTGITNDPKHTPEEIAEQKEKAAAARSRARSKVSGGQERPSSGYNGSQSRQYKAGDTISKGGREYVLYTGDDGKLHAKPKEK